MFHVVTYMCDHKNIRGCVVKFNGIDIRIHDLGKNQINGLVQGCSNYIANAVELLQPCTSRSMMASSNGNIFRVTGHLCGEFTGHRGIPRTKASDTEFWWVFFISTRINGWVNNGEPGDLRRHRAHYNVTVMRVMFRQVFRLPLAVRSINPANTLRRDTQEHRGWVSCSSLRYTEIMTSPVT